MEIVLDRERLVAALRERGVDYLAPSDASGAPVGEATLIASLASHADARLKQALSALFLVRPDLAPLVPGLVEALPRDAAAELTAQYQAAVYLQAMWGLQLERYQPGRSILPDFFSAQLGLPSPEDEYGKTGLYALADWHGQQLGKRANYLSEYQGTAGLILEQLRLRMRRHELAHAG